MSKIALLIGVSEYEPGLKPLPAAARDVEAVQEVLQHLEIGAFDEVNVLKNPGLLKMRQAISKLYCERDTEDLVLLYFSGHGLTDMSGRFFLTNRETENQGGLDKATALEASFIHDLMENCDSERQIIILDCCLSGAFPTGMTARNSGTIDFQNQLGGKGRIILTSSAATEYSFERQGEELAIYTRYLVEGIKTGAADLDKDGFISVNELHDYVKNQVQKAVPQMHPQRFIFKEGEKILLAKVTTNESIPAYRKLVEQCSFNGEIHSTGRRILERQRKILKISKKEASAIEDEVLRHYREYQRNLKEYEDCLLAEVKIEFPLSDRAQHELKILQRDLNLTESDIDNVTNRIIVGILPAPSITTFPTVPVIISPPRLSLPLKEFIFNIVILDRSGNEIDRASRQTYYFSENLDNKVSLEMSYIPEGSFLMGSLKTEMGQRLNETPQHLVMVKSFLMSKTPITQAQWKAIASSPQINQNLLFDPSNFKGATRPVENVSWHDAVEFCARLSQKSGLEYRLPTEAEWEYACRAGSTTPFHFGETLNPDVANYDASFKYSSGPKGVNRRETTEVNNFKAANALGLFDMHGNVWEWCLDHASNNYDDTPTDGSAWLIDGSSKSRILRGGSWYNDPRDCRSAFRLGWEADERIDRFGFRVVCSVV
jgi:formylglycine-generating enzyme required for sulfatase activity/uncharacterized caspase-like protein